MKRDTKGFTLIELLVVVAIIGLLSAIVMGSLQAARNKGNDSKKLQMVVQWQRALELYYDDNDTYPSTSTLTNNNSNYACLGDGYTGGGCVFSGEIVAEPNGVLASYYADAPIPENYLDFSGINIGGIGYKCGSTNSNCANEYVLIWFQQTNQCGAGSESGTFGSYTMCELSQVN